MLEEKEANEYATDCLHNFFFCAKNKVKEEAQIRVKSVPRGRKIVHDDGPIMFGKCKMMRNPS